MERDVWKAMGEQWGQPFGVVTRVARLRRCSRLFIAETSGHVHRSLDVTPETLLEHN